MKHRFSIWHVAAAATATIVVLLLLWCYSVLVSVVPTTINTAASVFAVPAALLGFCVFRTFTRWKQIGMWRRTYSVVTVVVLSSLLVAFVFLAAQDSGGMFSPECIWAVWKLERRGGRIQVEELRGKDVWVSLGVGDEPQVTDADLAYLEVFPRLYSFRLMSTQVTDAGLEHLQGAGRLHFLHLPFTNITDRGLRHLQGLAELEVLDLSGTKVTDAGLEHLKGLTQLRQIQLSGTKVTEAGVKKLQQALPKCEIMR